MLVVRVNLRQSQPLIILPGRRASPQSGNDFRWLKKPCDEAEVSVEVR